MGIEASIEMQAAARKVLDENKKLRIKLNQMGMNDDEIDSFVLSSAPANLGPHGGDRAGNVLENTTAAPNACTSEVATCTSLAQHASQVPSVAISKLLDTRRPLNLTPLDRHQQFEDAPVPTQALISPLKASRSTPLTSSGNESVTNSPTPRTSPVTPDLRSDPESRQPFDIEIERVKQEFSDGYQNTYSGLFLLDGSGVITENSNCIPSRIMTNDFHDHDTGMLSTSSWIQHIQNTPSRLPIDGFHNLDAMLTSQNIQWLEYGGMESIETKTGICID